MLYHPLYVSTKETKYGVLTGQQCGSAAVHTVVKDRGVQRWGRWYSQAPVGGRYFGNKKKGSSPLGQKKTPTYGKAHPPTTHDAVHPPPTHRPNLYYIQQYSSAAVRTAVHLVRGEQFVGWFLRPELVLYHLYVSTKETK